MANTACQLVSGAVEVVSWQISQHYGTRSANVSSTDAYVTNYMAWLGVWSLWLTLVGNLGKEYLPLFSAFLLPMHQQLASDMGEILEDPTAEEVKPKPSIGSFGQYSEFCEDLSAEIERSARKITEGIVSGNGRAARVDKFRHLLSCSLVYGSRCENFDSEMVVLQINRMATKLLSTLAIMSLPGEGN